MENFQKQLALELHRPKRKNFITRSFVHKGIRETFQIDLVEMGHLKQYNRGFNYILTCIDVTSKKAAARPLKSKRTTEVTQAFESILENDFGSPPKHVQSDQGKEFLSREFQSLMKRYKINHYHTYSEKKATIVERLNRTLKTKMYRHFTELNTYKWIDKLQTLIDDYNHAKHSSIGMKPISAAKTKNEALVLSRLNKRWKSKRRRFKAGDKVRVSRYKNIFVKGFLPNWSEEVFKIEKVLMTRPRTYKLVDLLDREIKGGFYNEELQLTQIPDYARVEKIIARKTDASGKKLIRVKWKGYSSEFNSWIPVDDTIKL